VRVSVTRVCYFVRYQEYVLKACTLKDLSVGLVDTLKGGAKVVGTTILMVSFVAAVIWGLSETSDFLLWLIREGLGYWALGATLCVATALAVAGGIAHRAGKNNWLAGFFAVYCVFLFVGTLVPGGIFAYDYVAFLDGVGVKHLMFHEHFAQSSLLTWAARFILGVSVLALLLGVGHALCERGQSVKRRRQRAERQAALKAYRSARQSPEASQQVLPWTQN
jgi:hypothetical protein